MTRDLDKEGRWKESELAKLSGRTGATIYSADELKGFEAFTVSYGYQLVYNNLGEAVKVLDSDGKEIPENSMYILDIVNYPELLEVLNK